jgi:hypothetical protein
VVWDVVIAGFDSITNPIKGDNSGVKDDLGRNHVARHVGSKRRGQNRHQYGASDFCAIDLALEMQGIATPPRLIKGRNGRRDGIPEQLVGTRDPAPAERVGFDQSWQGKVRTC